jgi:hypothetical protein
VTDDEVREAMRVLAGEVMAGEPGLTLSADGLDSVEREFTHFHRTHGARSVGAFLGEVITALADGKVRWVSFANAAARNSTVAKLGEDDETSALLQGGPSSFWFPHVKVGKRQRNGPADSLVAFKSVILAAVAPPVPEPPPPQSAADFHPAARAAAEAFLAARNRDTLKAFGRTVNGHVQRRHHGAFLRLHGIRAALFFDFLAMPDEGRGLKRSSPGGLAAEWVTNLIQAGIEPETYLDELRTRLTDRSSEMREHATIVLVRCWIRAAAYERAFELARGKDRVVRAAAFRALDTELYYEGERRGRDATFDIGPLEPILVLGFASERAVLSQTVQIVFRLAKWTDISRIAPLAAPILDRNEPGLVEAALDVFRNYGYSVMHGRAAYAPVLAEIVPKVVALTLPRAGAKKTTKVQIAARGLLSPLSKLDRHLDAVTLQAVREGLATGAGKR